jgi:hypothetical protein
MTMKFTVAYIVLESLHLAKRLLVLCVVGCEFFPVVSVRKISVCDNLIITSKLRLCYTILTTIYKLGKNNLDRFGVCL